MEGRMTRVDPRSRAAEPGATPSYGAAAIAALLVFLLYLATLAPSTAMWDTSEYITAAYVLGIPHPPGNPFFVLLGHVFTLLPIAPTVAQRVNVMAALTSAASAGIWFLVTERVLAAWLSTRWQRLVGAAAAVLIGATAFTVWDQSIVNEKVYTVSLLFFAIVAWLMVRWSDDPQGPNADRLLVMSAFLTGLGYTNHPAGFLVAPAVGVAILARRPRVLLDRRLMLRCGAALALGITPFLFEPIRAAQFPPLNEGEATACETRLALSCTLDHETWRRFAAEVSREQYGPHDDAIRQAPLSAQVGMYWLYFKWQWIRDATGQHPGLQDAAAALFLVLGLCGAYAHWRYDRRSMWFFGALVFTVTPALIYYMNFKYGSSQAPELGQAVPREPRDRDYFYLWSYSTWSVWVALGLVWLWESLARAIPLRERGRIATRDICIDRIPTRHWLATAPILVIALIPLIANHRVAPRREQVATRDVAKDLLDSVEPYGILVTVGDNDLFPLWYAQEVEGVRKDVLVVTTALLPTEWYAGQLIRRPVFPYDSIAGPAAYRGRVWPKPTRPPLAMTIAQSREIPEIVPLNASVTFRKKGTNLVARIDPARLPFGGLTRDQVFVLHLIADGSGRPVFFSTTDGTYADELGLSDHLLTEGLARKVVDDIPVATRDTLDAAGEGWIDTSRSLALWDDQSGPRTLLAHPGWVDRASVNIPMLYVVQGSVLAESLARRGLPGDTARARRVLGVAERLADNVGLGDIFRPREPVPAAIGDTPRGTLTP
jgi:Protein of unknown function (DUF2723)